jgi:hypothetical protein
MSWRAPTESDLSGSISAAEIAAYRAAAVDSSQGDPVTAQLASVLDLVRGYCRAGSVAMGPAGTIPETLIRPAMDYLAVDVVKRLPRGVSEDRRRARESALAIFRDVAGGKMRVEDYGASATASSGASAEVASSRPITTSPNQLGGLL